MKKIILAFLALIFVSLCFYHSTYAENLTRNEEEIRIYVDFTVNVSGCRYRFVGYIDTDTPPNYFHGTVEISSLDCSNCPCGSQGIGNGLLDMSPVFNGPGYCNMASLSFSGSDVTLVNNLNSISNAILRGLKNALGC